MYMTAIKEVNGQIIYIVIGHCYFVEYVELLPKLCENNYMPYSTKNALTSQKFRKWTLTIIISSRFCNTARHAFYSNDLSVFFAFKL